MGMRHFGAMVIISGALMAMAGSADLPTPTDPAVVIQEKFGEPLDKRHISITVAKKARRLTVYYRQQPIKTYAVVLGRNPIGDKLQQGDYKTPEGRFTLEEIYLHSQWWRFLLLDYPNAESWRKHRRAKANGQITPAANIGGEIGIHGVPEGKDFLIDRSINWTQGCVSLKNKDVAEVYELVQKGTVVEIVP
jgi:murein L,D-transpeptidase YafK